MHRPLLLSLLLFCGLLGCAENPSESSPVAPGDNTMGTGDGDGPAEGDGDADPMTPPADSADAATGGETPTGQAGDSDAGSSDGGNPMTDGGAATDGGLQLGTGSCCRAQEGPGCNNASLQVCVCEKDPSCCTEQWTAACALIVNSRFCQPEVRTCVCETWEQTDCCASQWSAFCDTVGEQKCEAIPGCF